jgi:beta-lactamase class D
MRVGRWIGWLSFLWLAFSVSAQNLKDIQTSLRGYDAAFIVKDLQTDGFLRINETRCQEQFPPFATLEIPLALAVLDTRVVRNLDSLLPWNRLKYPLRDKDTYELSHWPEDHTLRSAFAHSVEWYWWENSERLGTKRWQKALDKFGYGNQTFPNDLKLLWQDDALRISAQEQITFIQRLANESLPLPATWQRSIKAEMLRERSETYRLFMKTGSGLLQSGHYLGWSVGWLETEAGNYVFALNLTHRELQSVQEATVQLPKQLLAAAGYWPNQ